MNLQIDLSKKKNFKRLKKLL